MAVTEGTAAGGATPSTYEARFATNLKMMMDVRHDTKTGIILVIVGVLVGFIGIQIAPGSGIPLLGFAIGFVVLLIGVLALLDAYLTFVAATADQFRLLDDRVHGQAGGPR